MPRVIVFSNIPKLKSIKPIIENVYKYIYYKDKKALKTKATFNNSILIKELSFSYDDQKNVLQDISLEIVRGRKYLIVGESGCGKSTLVKLIIGYYSNYSGNIFYDDKNLNKLEIDSVSKISSVIHQYVFMFNETIYDNICLHDQFSKKY